MWIWWWENAVRYHRRSYCLVIHLDRWAFIVLFRLCRLPFSGKSEKWRQFNIVIAFQRPTTPHFYPEITGCELDRPRTITSDEDGTPPTPADDKYQRSGVIHNDIEYMGTRIREGDEKLRFAWWKWRKTINLKLSPVFFSPTDRVNEDKKHYSPTWMPFN